MSPILSCFEGRSEFEGSTASLSRGTEAEAPYKGGLVMCLQALSVTLPPSIGGGDAAVLHRFWTLPASDRPCDSDVWEAPAARTGLLGVREVSLLRGPKSAR
jgi:hypothetical protein